MIICISRVNIYNLICSYYHILREISVDILLKFIPLISAIFHFCSTIKRNYMIFTLKRYLMQVYAISINIFLSNAFYHNMVNGVFSVDANFHLNYHVEDKNYTKCFIK